MKKLFLILLLFAAFGFIDKSEARYRGGNHAVDFFYYDLEPYGEWIEIDYDVFVWRPNSVHYSWQPYSVGRWVWSSDGWYWDSYEPFGWATYHYGRWFYDDYYGWVWMPDTRWGPSWVEWRYNDRYIGWAPLPPYAEFRINVGIHFSISWRSNPMHWHFVRYDHFHHNNVNRYFEAARYNNKIFGKTKYRTNYYERKGRVFNGGVGREYVERRAGNKFRTYDLHDSRTRIKDYKSRDRDSERMEVYRPSEDVMRKAREIDRNKITRGSKSTSLRTDKIAIRKDRSDEQRDMDELVKSRTRNTERTVNDRDNRVSKERNDSRDIRKESEAKNRNKNYLEGRNSRGKEDKSRKSNNSVRNNSERNYSNNRNVSGTKEDSRKLNNRQEKKQSYSPSSTPRQNSAKSYSKPERKSSAQSYERKAKSSRAKTKSYSKPKSEKKESSSRSYKRSSSSDSKSKSSSRSGIDNKKRVRSRR